MLNENSPLDDAASPEGYREGECGAERDLRIRQAECDRDLATRQQSAREIREQGQKQLDLDRSGYEAERQATASNIAARKVAQEAAHSSAREHCSEIGVLYQPGVTTEADILAVTKPTEAEAAKQLGLPFGVGFQGGFLPFTQKVLTGFCWLTASMSLGLGLRLLNPRDLAGSPVNLALSLVLGGVAAVGTLVAITYPWKGIGTKVGACRPTREIVAALIPIGIVTAMILFGLASLDATALMHLNAARAAINPALAISLPIAFLIGGVLSGVYVVGLGAAAFTEGYTTAAGKSIQAWISAAERASLEEAKAKTKIQLALSALSRARIADEIVRRTEEELEALDQSFAARCATLLASLPEVPSGYPVEERKELADLRARARSARIQGEAEKAARDGVHLRSLNGAGEVSTTFRPAALS